MSRDTSRSRAEQSNTLQSVCRFLHVLHWPYLPQSPCLSVCLSTQEASQPLNLTSKSKGLELRVKTPSPQALELGSLGLQGGFRPRDFQREVAHSPQRSALSKSCFSWVGAWIRELKQNEPIQWCKHWPSHKYQLSFTSCTSVQRRHQHLQHGQHQCNNTSAVVIKLLFVLPLQFKHIRTNSCSREFGEEPPSMSFHHWNYNWSKLIHNWCELALVVLFVMPFWIVPALFFSNFQ